MDSRPSKRGRFQRCGDLTGENGHSNPNPFRPNNDSQRNGGGSRSLDVVTSRPPNFDKRGTSGRPVRMVTNYYKLEKDGGFRMLLYSVTVEPPVENHEVARRLVRTKTRNNPGIFIMTGLQVFTTRPIPPELQDFQAFLKEAPGIVYDIHLEYIREVEENEGVVFQFYNSLVRMIQRTLKYQLVGRQYFDPNQKVEFPGRKLQLWPGFANSVRQLEDSSLMLNVESCWKVLYTESVFEKMKQIRANFPETYEKECESAIVGMMVITRYNNKAYKISGIDYNTTPEGSFEKGDKLVTYHEYYRERYGLTVTASRQPMLVSEPRFKDVRKGQTEVIYLIPEFCFPCGLNEELRKNFPLMKELAGHLHNTPEERVEIMDQFIQRVYTEEIQSTLRNWGVTILPEKVTVPARLLEPVEILFGEDPSFVPGQDAEWSSAIRCQKMRECCTLKRWAIVVTGKDRYGVSNLIGTMQKVGAAIGYQILSPFIEQIPENKIESYKAGIDTVMKKTKGEIDMVLVILSSSNSQLYSAVKQKCLSEYGVPSQCCLTQKFINGSRNLMTICTKMVIQMNAKQGGEPWGIKVPCQSLMVVGYDVHHAGAFSGGMSVGAMTATVNQSLGKSFSTVAPLSSREEVAPVVGIMFEKCLDAYYERNNSLPSRIMMYRDGVGDGQLTQVFEQEVNGLKVRIQSKYGEKQVPLPKLTFIVVNKRINTRFFEPCGAGFRNPKPGCVVDDVVTRLERYDFYLVSHTARQGCVSPTYYHVIYDESGLSPDNLQKFTYQLCHLYFNWSGAVAVPGPCQNAHKLAYLVGTALKQPAKPSLAFTHHYL